MEGTESVSKAHKICFPWQKTNIYKYIFIYITFSNHFRRRRRLCSRHNEREEATQDRDRWRSVIGLLKNHRCIGKETKIPLHYWSQIFGELGYLKHLILKIILDAQVPAYYSGQFNEYTMTIKYNILWSAFYSNTLILLRAYMSLIKANEKLQSHDRWKAGNGCIYI